MKFLAKNNCFSIFLFISTVIVAQKPAIPVGFSASYQKYNNRIELTWQATAANHLYKIFRREQVKKSFELIDSVSQNRYVDRKGLRMKTSYIYRIRAVTPNGSVSELSNEATGALLLVASDIDTSITVNTQRLKNCVDVTLIEGKASPKSFTIKFSVASKCDIPKGVQLTLYRSDDALLDAQDDFLSQQSFDLTRTRGALVSNNNGEQIKGYFLLKVETNEDSFIVVRKIE